MLPCRSFFELCVSCNFESIERIIRDPAAYNSPASVFIRFFAPSRTSSTISATFCLLLTIPTPVPLSQVSTQL